MTTSMSSKGQPFLFLSLYCFYFLILYNPCVFFSFLFTRDEENASLKLLNITDIFGLTSCVRELQKETFMTGFSFINHKSVQKQMNECIRTIKTVETTHSLINQSCRDTECSLCFCRIFSYTTSDWFEIRRCLHSKLVCD